MKAIILAAGKWTRLLPITENIPKSMVEVFWTSLLEYNMKQLVDHVDEFIIIVKYKQEAIRTSFWNDYQWVPITYHEQWAKSWTAWALEWIGLQGDCYILASDTLYRDSDICKLVDHNGYWVLCRKVENPEKYGTFKVDEHMKVESVVEKSPTPYSNLASVFYFKLNSDMITYAENVEVSERWEYELTDALNMFVKKNKVTAIKIQHEIQDITSPEDLENANTLTKPELWKTRYLENIGDYEVHLWIPETWVQEIVDYSTDETDTALREWTSDWKKRFISVENLTSWYQDKERYPFTLLSKDWTVAGLWWWRTAECPKITEILNENLYSILQENLNNTHTWAIRIYPFARWDRLASPFMKICSKYYGYIFENIHMCVDIDAENIPSQKAFERLEYEKIGYWKNVNNSPESWKKRFVYMKRP